MRGGRTGSGRTGPGRLGRLLRELAPDRNPLRRTVDRVEAAVLAVLAAVFLAVGPLAAVAAGNWASAASRATLRAEGRWHQVRAVLLRSAPDTPHAMFQAAPDRMVPARWAAPDGVPRTGEVYVPARARAGQTIRIWTDASGRKTGYPVQPSDVAVQALTGGTLAVLALAALLLACGLTARKVLDRWRLAAWDTNWTVTGPQWTGRR